LTTDVVEPLVEATEATEAALSVEPAAYATTHVGSPW
jgi:hypothetical protein